MRGYVPEFLCIEIRDCVDHIHASIVKAIREYASALPGENDIRKWKK
jgi:hypothetical protein